MNRYTPLLVLLLLMFCNNIKGQTTKLPKHQNYAILFAVTDYDNVNLPKLTNPIKNAEDISKALSEKYGFKCELVKNPTYETIKNKLKEYAKNFEESTFDTEGQILIFFSGHGKSELKNGYFLPKGYTPKDELGTAFSYNTWRGELDKFLCKHILVVIDACESGSFDPEHAFKSVDPLDGRSEISASEGLILRANEFKTRLFITSTTADGKAPDDSQFAYNFLLALRSGDGQDSILSYNKLNTYLENNSQPSIYGRFGDNSPGSNFLFISKKGEFSDEEIEKMKRSADSLRRVINNDNKMITVKGGEFSMGNSDGLNNQKPAHSVKVPNFYIGRNEMTIEEYNKYCEDIRSNKPYDNKPNQGKLPVINVSWIDAVKYCNWLSEREKIPVAYNITSTSAERIPNSKGYRLPTEAEWEFAATYKNGDFKFSGSDDLNDVVLSENSKGKSAIVGSKNKPNGIGANDMSGNVSEWVEDCWVENYKSSPQDGSADLSGDCKYRVLRGGSWLYKYNLATTHYRLKKGINEHSRDCGFRIARSK